MTFARYRRVCFLCFLIVTAPTLRIRAQTTPAPATAVPAFVAVHLAEVEAEREALSTLRIVIGEVRASLNLADPTARCLTLVEAAKRLHALVPRPDIRAALEVTLEVLKADPPPPILVVPDEQKKWDNIADAIDAELRRSGQGLDALRLIRQALTIQPTPVRLLLQAEHVLETLDREQPAPILARLIKYTRETLAALPPPTLFTSTLDIDLVLLAQGSKEPASPSVYVSEEPVNGKAFTTFLNDISLPPEQLSPPATGVCFDLATRKFVAASPGAPVTGISHDLASAFCRWASGKAQLVMELPTEGQLRRLPESQAGTVALWTSTRSTPADELEREMRAHFGVVMFAIWQPPKKNSAEAVTEDLPLASCPELGFRVATSVQAVKKAWLERVHAEMNLPPANGTVAPAKPAGSLP